MSLFICQLAVDIARLPVFIDYFVLSAVFIVPPMFIGPALYGDLICAIMTFTENILLLSKNSRFTS